MTGLPKLTVERLLQENLEHDCNDARGVCVRIVAVAELPTIYGHFQAVAFENNVDKKEHAALVKGDIFDRDDVPVRMHSECLTGDVFGSLRCDCREQLQHSMKAINEMERGIIFYLRQEGRGIGFVNKIRAYQLQDHGKDTYEANIALGFRPDERDYDLAAHMIGSLHVKSVKLMTNNPQKIKDLQLHGVKITGRIPVIIPANRYNAFYLETKRVKGGHLLEPGQLHDIFLEQGELPQDQDPK